MTHSTFDVVHVKGDLDAQHLISRQPMQIQQGSHILSGTGAPSAAAGVNGDLYIRKDGGSMTHLYYKIAGSWAGIV
jgi:hypothetical protein